MVTDWILFWQMTTAISVEDVRREVKILKALSGHKHMIKFHDAFEDANNVYIIMEYVFTCHIVYFLNLQVTIFFPGQSCMSYPFNS